MTGIVDKIRAVDTVNLDFRKAFVTVSHTILIEKLLKCGLNEKTVMWTENCLNGQTQRVLMSDTKSSWRLITIPEP